MRKIKPEYFDEIYEIFTSIKDPKEAQDFFEDMFTPQELETLAERWQLVSRLLEGLPQRKIAEDLGIAVATVSRGSRQIKYGTGAIKKMWTKWKK